VLYTQEVWEAEAKSAPGRNIRLGIYAAVGGGSGLLAVGRVHAPPHPPPSALTLTLTLRGRFPSLACESEWAWVGSNGRWKLKAIAFKPPPMRPDDAISSWFVQRRKSYES
jgi:hypothetical protein